MSTRNAMIRRTISRLFGVAGILALMSWGRCASAQHTQPDPSAPDATATPDASAAAPPSATAIALSPAPKTGRFRPIKLPNWPWPWTSLQPATEADTAAILMGALEKKFARIQDSTQDKAVFGTEDFVPWFFDETQLPANINPIPKKYRRLGKAFGYLSNGCTATHIGDGVALTAGHCLFLNPTPAVEDRPCPEQLRIRWGRFYVSLNPVRMTIGHESSCTRILAAEFTAQRDYALLKISSSPAACVDVDLSARLKPGKAITVFGHPAGLPLTWSGGCELRPSRVLPWAEYRQKSIFAHQCDSLVSSSGSPVLDDQSLKLVGVHDGGNVTGRQRDNTNDGWNFGTYVVDIPAGQFLLPPRVDDLGDPRKCGEVHR